MTAEAERIRHGHADAPFMRDIGDVTQIALRIDLVEIDRRRNGSVGRLAMATTGRQYFEKPVGSRLIFLVNPLETVSY